MTLCDPALTQLAAHYSIATEFWDWKGRHTDVTAQTVIAVLAALEVDAGTPEAAQAALREAHDRPWRRMLPPVVVFEQGQGAHIPVHVAAGHPVGVRVKLEDGGSRDAWQVDNWEPDREVDGEWLGEATFVVPGDLPLGYHRIVAESDDRQAEVTLIVTPSFVGFPASMGDKRIWGYASQLYSVRSQQSWGVGDLTDLTDLAVWSATQQFAGYILINPLHAAQPMPPLEPSPYLPSSRRFVNPLYIRPEAIQEYAELSQASRDRIAGLHKKLQATLEKLDRQTREADESGVSARIHRDQAWEAKLEALRVVYAAGLRPAREMAYDDFVRREGRGLRDFATWCALYRHTNGKPWREWPIEFRRPTSPEVAEFYHENLAEVDFFMWLQWIADQQLSQAQRTALDCGMSVGVVTDLAVGVARDGADTWMMADIYAEGVSVGAPPDPYNQFGQDWGQPPWRPDRLEDLAYAPFRQMVAGALRHSGGVRVDHIIGLFRLWWVPQGGTAKDGTYVRYNHEAMVGILALEAQRAGALVIGEDLGTVEPWVRDYLSRRGILGTSVLWFEFDESGRPLAADRWREYCMASVVTHDLPPSAGYLAGDHVRLRHRLGLLTESLDEELALDKSEKQAWLDRLVEYGVLEPGTDDVETIVLALHRYLTLTRSRVLNAALTDAVGDRLTQNQPGTIDEYPNWRVPLSGPDGRPLDLDEVFESERAARVAAVLNGFSTLPERR